MKKKNIQKPYLTDLNLLIDLCKIYVKFILAKFMASSSNFGNNLAEEIHKIKCKYGNDDEKM